MKYADIIVPAIVTIFIAIVTFLIGNEAVDMTRAFTAAAFAGFASGTSVACAYAVGKNAGWNRVGIGIVLSLIVSILTAFGMTL